MDEYEKLVQELAEERVLLDETPLPNCNGMSRQTSDVVYNNVNVALPLRLRFSTLAHEIGHLKTMEVGTASQIEHRANKYSVHRAIPWIKLLEAYSNGYETVHDLADYFQVDEKFLRQALHIYGITI